MLTALPIKRRYNGYLCRHCINREYRANLKPHHCRYRYGKDCACCHASNHLVVGFTLRGMGRMLLKF